MRKNRDLILSIMIPIIVALWEFLYYKILFHNNMLISLDDLSENNIFNILIQHIVVNLPIVIFLMITLKKINYKKLYFNLPTKRLWKIILIILVIICFALFIYGFSISHNIVKVLYSFIFYLIFVSVGEEFIFRCLIPFLQKDKIPKIIEWLLPNILFSLTHLIVLFVDTSGLNEISLITLIIYLITTIIFGVVMELLKRKSGSLYVPILAHTIYDFYGEIMLWL